MEESPEVSTRTEYPFDSSSTMRSESDGCEGSRLMQGRSRIRWARRWITCSVAVATPSCSPSSWRSSAGSAAVGIQSSR